MTAGADSPHLAVEHVRQSRQRMPISGVPAAKCMGYPMKGQSARDRRICINVLVIIVVDEVVADGLAKHHPGNDNQEKTNAQSLAACG